MNATLFILVLTAVLCLANAVAIVSKADGNWNDAETWEGEIIPTEVDDVTLEHAVTISSGSIELNSLDVAVNAHLYGFIDITCRSDITIAGEVKAVDGIDGSLVETTANEATGGAGGNGGDVFLAASGNLIISGDVGSGNGGRGASVSLHGASGITSGSEGTTVVCTAGNGGNGGSITMTSSQISFDAECNIVVGNGGSSGDLDCSGGDGYSYSVVGDVPGAGGGVTANGGSGGASGQLVIQRAAPITKSELESAVSGGSGGEAMIPVAVAGKAGSPPPFLVNHAVGALGGYAKVYGGNGGNGLFSPKAGADATAEGGDGSGIKSGSLGLASGGNGGDVINCIANEDVVVFVQKLAAGGTAVAVGGNGGAYGGSGGAGEAHAGNSGNDDGLHPPLECGIAGEAIARGGVPASPPATCDPQTPGLNGGNGGSARAYAGISNTHGFYGNCPPSSAFAFGESGANGGVGYPGGAGGLPGSGIVNAVLNNDHGSTEVVTVQGTPGIAGDSCPILETKPDLPSPPDPEELGACGDGLTHCISYVTQETCINTYPTYQFILGQSCPRDASAHGEPHFYGFCGQKFDFDGDVEKVFNLVSDRHFVLNSKFIGQKDARLEKEFTYMGEYGIQFNSDKIFIGCNDDGGVSIKLNGTEIAEGINMGLSGGSGVMQGHVVRHGDNVAIRVPRYQIAIKSMKGKHQSEPKCYFNMRSRYQSLRGEEKLPHGIIGQTARQCGGINSENPIQTKFWIPAYRKGQGVIEGYASEYVVPNVMTTEYKYSQFTGEIPTRWTRNPSNRHLLWMEEEEWLTSRSIRQEDSFFDDAFMDF